MRADLQKEKQSEYAEFDSRNHEWLCDGGKLGGVTRLCTDFVA